jgi:hypothetical protein
VRSTAADPHRLARQLDHTIGRPDFQATTSNEQLNFPPAHPLDAAYRRLTSGRVAGQVLFEAGSSTRKL